MNRLSLSAGYDSDTVVEAIAQLSIMLDDVQDKLAAIGVYFDDDIEEVRQIDECLKVSEEVTKRLCIALMHPSLELANSPPDPLLLVRSPFRPGDMVTPVHMPSAYEQAHAIHAVCIGKPQDDTDTPQVSYILAEDDDRIYYNAEQLRLCTGLGATEEVEAALKENSGVSEGECFLDVHPNGTVGDLYTFADMTPQSEVCEDTLECRFRLNLRKEEARDVLLFVNEHVCSGSLPYYTEELLDFLQISFGFCCCFDPVANIYYIANILRNLSTYCDSIEDAAAAFHLYVLGKEGLTVHGSSLCGGMLTEKGKAFLRIVDMVDGED